MTKVLGGLADRLVGAIVPKTTAGACPCNDCWNTPWNCGHGFCRRCCTNCNCTITTCEGCYIC